MKLKSGDISSVGWPLDTEHSVSAVYCETVSDRPVNDIQSSVDGLQMGSGEDGVHWVSSETAVQLL